VQRPYFQVRSHSHIPGDTFWKSHHSPHSMGLEHIPIWRPGPMQWVTQLVQDNMISRSFIPSAKTLFPNLVILKDPGWT
jgi:hypothetical protein